MKTNGITELDKVIKKTIKTIEEGREQIFDIAENAREELHKIKREIDEIRAKVIITIDRVEKLVKDEKSARVRLMNVSRDFSKYSEKEIKEAYDYASKLQAEMIISMNEEKSLIVKRNELEARLRNLEKTVEKAQELISNINIAMGYISGDLMDLWDQIEQKHSFGTKVIKALEEERKKMAREVHDGPAQSMANILIRFEICEKFMDTSLEKAKEELKDLRALVKNCLHEVRKIIYDLRPMSLDDLGLPHAIRRHIEIFKEDCDLEVSQQLNGEGSYSEAVYIVIFRILQEALTNVKKHSKASRVWIKLEEKDDFIILKVRDNGVGISDDSNERESQNKFGIIGMRERAELLNGSFEIDSVLNQGTKITVSIPKQNGGEQNADKGTLSR